MDNEIMFGILASKSLENQRSITVPYLHDRLYESLVQSGYMCLLPSPCLRSSKMGGPQPVGPNTNWKFLRACISTCVSDHSDTCGRSFNNKYTPLKVIDCQSQKVVKFPRNAEYLALSYIWGSEQSDTYAIKHNILPDTIPTTISDAMETTLQLGFRFLWVDRYCIPQSNDFIKHKEIRNMDMIYIGAICTIIACSGMNPWYGLPGCSSRPRLGSDPVAVNGRVLFSVPPDPRYEIEKSNWMNRGWTYQEGLLSRRRIFFTSQQVYFECDARHSFESTAPLLNKLLWKTSQKARIFSISGSAIGRHEFYKTINQYSGRKLTYDSNILNGVWGVLRTFQYTPFPIRHYWGVPVYAKQSGFDCIAGFAWDLVKPGQRRVGFPSWSWSGWIGQIKPGLLVNFEPASKFTRPQTQPRMARRWITRNSSSKSQSSSNTIETPQDIFEINQPNPLEGDITLRAEHIDGSLLPYLDASWQYSNSGGRGLSRFLRIRAGIIPATLSTSGVLKVTIDSTSWNIFPSHHPLEWLSMTDEAISGGSEMPIRPCSAIALAIREPLSVKRKKLHLTETYEDVEIGIIERKTYADGDIDGEVEEYWLCLFLIVEWKGDCFERIGLAKWQFDYLESMDKLIQTLESTKKEIRLG